MDEGHPQVHNQGTVQGQNIGHYQQITQYFGSTLTLPACELVRRQRLEYLSLSARERQEIWRLTQAESAK